MYIKHGDGTIVPLPGIHSTTGVPAGIYNFRYVDINGGKSIGLSDISEAIKIEPIIQIDSPVFKDTVAYADQFQANSDKYKTFGISHKTGILLYGSEGTGKTVLAKNVALKMVTKGYIVIYIRNNDDFDHLSSMIKWIRHDKKMKNAKCCVIIDEFEQYVVRNEQQVLRFMDGDDSQDGVITIAITNYIKNIPTRILRPSRFGFIREVPHLDPEIIQQYITEKLTGIVPKEELDKFRVRYFDRGDLSIDMVKDDIVKTFIIGGRFKHSDFDIQTNKQDRI